MVHRLLACLALVVLAVGALSSTPEASAAWSAAGSGPAVQRTMTMPAMAAPTVTGMSAGVLGYTYTVTWPTAMMWAGRPVTGYVVTRTGAGALLSGSGCAGVLTAQAGAQQSCTDTVGLTAGTPRYSVTALFESWSSLPSASVGPTP